MKRDLDSRDAPAYGLGEAARYVRLPAATLRSWVAGRPYPRAGGMTHSRPLIRPPARLPLELSFLNLIEAHVLRSLRTEHGVPLKHVRKALDYAEHHLGIDRLLLSEQLCTTAGRVFLDRYGQLIDLSASGQLALRRLFQEHLKRIEWGHMHLPARLYPFPTAGADPGGKPIVIDPQVAFGRPVVARGGIATQTITDRIDAGESVEHLARDYGLEPREIEEAVLYERAA